MIKTPEYVSLRKQHGHETVHAAKSGLHHLDRMLLKDRMAVVIFLVGFMIFAYTILRAPLFAK
jgi:hypothetical protein